MSRFRNSNVRRIVLAAAFPFAAAAAAQEPVPVNVGFELLDAVGAPGEAIGVPFLLRNQGPLGVRGFTFSVDFDEEILQATDVRAVWQPPVPTENGMQVLRFNNDNRIPGSSGVAEGFIYGAIFYDFVEPIVLPLDQATEVARFHFRVREDAPETATSIIFVDGAPSGPEDVVFNAVGVGSDNNAVQTVYPESAESFIFVGCQVTIGEIVVDLAIFRRGDADGDAYITLSDPITTFNFLFLGDAAPRCLDAADADDDGLVLLTDGIFTLNYLFLRGRAPPAPGPYAAGLDPTADRLVCPRTPSP